MNKNGFTLIELLAVIVILAIIALIATPIILGIINDARKESQERSAELYLSGVDLAVARRNLTEEFNPSKCTIANGIVTCEGYEEPLYVDVDGEVPVSGTIEFENNKASTGTTLEFTDFTATLNSEGKLVIGEAEEQEPENVIEIGKLNSVCEPAETQYFQQTAMEPGYEYNCKVDPNAEPYTFYVLNKNGNQINLIMDRNLVSSSDWLSEADYERLTGKSVADNFFDFTFNAAVNLGPVSAVKSLSESTITWTNLNQMIINTFDKDGAEASLGESITSYARLPKYSEINQYNPETQEYAYLYDNLSSGGNCVSNNQQVTCTLPNGIEYMTIAGYRTQTVYSETPNIFSVDASIHMVSPNGGNGIRPVITLDI